MRDFAMLALGALLGMLFAAVVDLVRGLRKVRRR